MNSLKKLPVYALFIAALCPVSSSAHFWGRFDEMFEDMEREMAASRKRMRSLFEELDNVTPAVKSSDIGLTVTEEKENVIIKLDVGMVNSDDIAVEVDNGVATVRVPLENGRIELQIADSRLFVGISHQVVRENKGKTVTSEKTSSDKDIGMVEEAHAPTTHYATQSAFSSQFQSLPARVDVNNIAAEYKDGQLVLTVAKKAAKKIVVTKR